MGSFLADFLKILLYTDLTIRPDQLFWHRDLGPNALLVVHLATEPRTTPTMPNELDPIREQPFEVPQVRDEVGPPRPSLPFRKGQLVAFLYPCSKDIFREMACDPAG